MYLGERINDRGTSVGYGMRLESLGGWQPQMLGQDLWDDIEPTNG